MIEHPQKVLLSYKKVPFWDCLTDVSDIFVFCSRAGEREEASKQVAGWLVLIETWGGASEEEVVWGCTGAGSVGEGGQLNIFVLGLILLKTPTKSAALLFVLVGKNIFLRLLWSESVSRFACLTLALAAKCRCPHALPEVYKHFNVASR